MAEAAQGNTHRSSSSGSSGPPSRSSSYSDRRDNRGDSRGGDQRGGGQRRMGGRRFQKKKVCRFTKEGVVYIDFKNYRLLRDFLTERGKIMPRRITGISAKHQRMLTQAIKRARHMALIPFVSNQ